jgi:hypothetical protein
MRTPDPLSVADLSEHLILRFMKAALNGSLEEIEFLLEQLGSNGRQRLNQVLQHRAEPAGDLNALAAKVANLGDGQLNEILPIGCSMPKPQLPSPVAHLPIVEFAQTHLTKQVV